GGAEAIRRLSRAALLAGSRCVWVPQPGFGDYAAAALALNMNVRSYRSITELCQGLADADLVWFCEPCNPSGSTLSGEDWQALSLALQAAKASLAIDQAYEPLRLHGHSQLPADLAAQAWCLHCPNKALGLTGVRAAYLLAPAQADRLLAHAQAVAPSWVLSSEGCALLMHWHSEDTRRHLSEVRSVLRGWQAAQQQMLDELGWQQTPSCSNFWLARPSQALCLQRLRNSHNDGGIKLRDAQSFGLRGWVRLSVQPPESQAALRAALQEELKTQ
ncbi:MAG: aminotransferase class I/II-fold pyridoxal phosphate-dependent enzyme, partial [Burkholderiaceae bacterium]|nr:aminotransferase class I/II-fold pyridoxal phosphate-dependent enzyme [Burkholderiaceae bacterium]